MTLTLVFSGWLPGLLRHPHQKGTVLYPLLRRASIKDIIEALGVPHTEVGNILANASPVAFSYLARPGDRIEIFPMVPPVAVDQPTLLRPETIPAGRFLVDANVGKLAGLLRMAGLDAAYGGQTDDAALARRAHDEQRVLVSRDRQLLKHKLVEHGHLVRAAAPEEQLIEVISFYGLGNRLRPFSRCLRCNEPLAAVAKEDILSHLEPLTKKYYHHFRRCPACGRIYWPGSHRARMERLLSRLLPQEPGPQPGPAKEEVRPTEEKGVQDDS